MKKFTFENATLDYSDQLHSILDAMPKPVEGEEATLGVVTESDFIQLVDTMDKVIGAGYRKLAEQQRYISKLEKKLAKRKKK